MVALSESKQIAEIADSLCTDITSVYPSLFFKVLIYRRGQRQDEAEKAIASFNGHPAYEAARDLLRLRQPGGETSAFLGIAVGHERGLFGIKGRSACIGFIGLNLDQYSTFEETQYALYHMVGQFFDLMGLINSDAFKTSGEVIVPPKRNALTLARANMKADIFSALMMTSQGQKEAIRDLARWRGMQALVGQSYQRPEEFPYTISVDVTEFAAEKIQGNTTPKVLQCVSQLASNVSKTFDKQNLETWIHFTSPAQTMAWSGYAPEHILGAAIHTCPNPFIKSVGHLVSEVTHLEPMAKEALQSGYNPFVDIEINQIAHERQVEDTFDMVMVHSMEADSALPLLRVANNQNENMVKGKVLGWCAHALQAAAKAYDTALRRGIPAEQAARLEFESAKHQTSWGTLNKINDQILSQRRHGFAVTLTDIASWCKNTADFRPVLESVNLTLADPTYARKLAAAQEPPQPAPGFGPKPQMAMNLAPQMAFAPMAPRPPGLGGGAIAARATYVAQTTTAKGETGEEKA